MFGSEQAPDKEFHREVVDALHILLVISLLGQYPPLDEPVADRYRHRQEIVIRCRRILVLGERILPVGLER